MAGFSINGVMVDMPASCMPRCCCKLSPEEEMMMKMGTMHEGYNFSAEEKADIQTLNEYFLYLSEKVDFFNRAKSVYLTISVKLAYQILRYHVYYAVAAYWKSP